MKRFFFALFFSLTVLVYAADGKATVYLSKSGARYHRVSCSTLRAEKTPVTLEEAVRAGKMPCTVCKPDELDARALKAVQDAEQAVIYRVNVAGLKSYRDADVSRMLEAEVIRSVDGDTVEVRVKNPPPGINPTEKIRMIGVDTPETVHPRKEVEHFGKEASNFTRQALLGKRVYLAFDWELRDKYKRILCYIYTAPGVCHNAELLKQGYGSAYTNFAFFFMDEFVELGRQARAAKRGLYAD
jgi:micrococcal nuclease